MILNERTSNDLGMGSDTLSPRLKELRVKIHDKKYLDGAILRIAQVISNKLIEDQDTLKYKE